MDVRFIGSDKMLITVHNDWLCMYTTILLANTEKTIQNHIFKK